MWQCAPCRLEGHDRCLRCSVQEVDGFTARRITVRGTAEASDGVVTLSRRLTHDTTLCDTLRGKAMASTAAAPSKRWTAAPHAAPYCGERPRPPSPPPLPRPGNGCAALRAAPPRRAQPRPPLPPPTRPGGGRGHRSPYHRKGHSQGHHHGHNHDHSTYPPLLCCR